ncbi:MAG TPA: NAD(P)-dependent oxidoreductase [Terriglobia bacterium]|nr:NAD(P)-dependent oxidoreductase [Terriglobia bacterium]
MIRRHRILVIGRNGQLAQALEAAEWPSLTSLHFAGRDEIDLFHPLRLRQQLSALGPEIIINTAGYARIDLAAQEPEAAFALNAMAVETLATAAAMLDIPLLHHSSAHVFSGDRSGAYVESDQADPVSIYGQSMQSGEAAIRRARGRYLILRTSRLFGLHGDNFLKSILALGRKAEHLGFTANGYACPTPTEALAAIVPHIAIAMIEERRFPLILHYAGDMPASWYEIASEIFALAGRYMPVPELAPIEVPAGGSTASGSPAKGCNLALDSSQAHRLGLPRVDWRAALPALIETLCQSDALSEAAAAEPALPLAAVHAA